MELGDLAELKTAKRWARAWKAAAKRQKRDADRFLVAWIRASMRLEWKSRRASVWKQAAKRWRKRALESEREHSELEKVADHWLERCTELKIQMQQAQKILKR